MKYFGGPKLQVQLRSPENYDRCFIKHGDRVRSPCSSFNSFSTESFFKSGKLFVKL